jgi:type II secretory pathway pseudopilin PulG
VIAKRKAKRTKKGIGMLEALVALSLVAIVGTLLAGGVQFGRRAWERADTRAERTVTLSTRDALRDILERVMSYRRSESDAVIAFEGKTDQITFVGVSNAQTESGALQKIDLVVRSTNSGWYVLEYSAFGIRAIDSQPGIGSTNLLIAAVAPKFYFFGPLSVGGPAEWHDRWRNAARLPRMLKVEWQQDGRAEVLLVDLSNR